MRGSEPYCSVCCRENLICALPASEFIFLLFAVIFDRQIRCNFDFHILLNGGNKLDNKINDTVLASNEFPYVLFEVSDNICGVSCSKMLSIQILDSCTPMINSPAYVRGCTNFRGTFIPLVDIRKMTGQETQLYELEVGINFAQRKKDHENWINTLEKSVFEGIEFTLTDDPHKCAFGKWYDSFQSENLFIKKLMASIDAPHQAVHKTATQVKELMKNGDKDGALALIGQTRNTHFKEVLRLLDALDEKLHEEVKEMMVVVETVDGPKGLIVDHVVGVETIDSFEPVPAHLSHADHVICIGRQEKSQEAILIFDCDKIK